MRERVEAMKAIWTQDEASYHGEYVNFERIWSWPKPAQRPHPPVLVGGNGPTVLDRVLAFGDAWFPNYGRGGVLDRIAELRERAERPTRDPGASCRRPRRRRRCSSSSRGRASAAACALAAVGGARRGRAGAGALRGRASRELHGE